MNNTPLWANDTSPSLALRPPPMIAPWMQFDGVREKDAI